MLDKTEAKKMSTGSRGGGVYMRAKAGLSPDWVKLEAAVGRRRAGERGAGQMKHLQQVKRKGVMLELLLDGIRTRHAPTRASLRGVRGVWVGVEQYGCVTFQSSAVFGEQRRSLVVTLGTDRGLAGSECGYECERE